MRQMKDSGIPWVGEIPETWKVGRIDNFYMLRNTKVSDRDYQPLSVTKNGIVPQLETAAKTNAHDDRKLVRSGDFVINSRSDRRGSCGISSYEGSVSLINTVLAPRGEMTARFYDWLFHTIQFADEFYRWGHGIVDDLWTTTYQDMKKINIPVPPLSEQTSIATYLDAKCAEIDALSADVQSEIDLLESYKRSVITEAVTKGLDKNAAMKDSGIPWIGEIPETWECIKFKYIATVKSNLVSPNDYGDYPQISPESIEKETGRLLPFKTVCESGVISGNHLFYKGQILYSKIRPKLNKVTIAPFDGLCSADMYPIETSLDKQFFVYALRSDAFLLNVGMITEDRIKMPKINREELANICFAVPSREEQTSIATYLDAKCAEIDAVIDQKREQIAVLNDYKKSVIYEYVTGKKEVPAR